jgi:hypothetical protein
LDKFLSLPTLPTVGLFILTLLLHFLQEKLNIHIKIQIQCNNGICNNAVYFKKLIDEMNSGKYNKVMYDYFLNIDCENYDFTNNRPITSFMKT